MSYTPSPIETIAMDEAMNRIDQAHPEPHFCPLLGLPDVARGA